MHVLSIALLSLVPLTTALQPIYLATNAASGYLGTYLAFFSDSDPCQDGTRIGFLPYGFVNCDQDITILGHQNITFTGCQKPCTAPYPYCYPTGVSDNGAPALTCRNATTPPNAPGIEYGIYAVCEPGTINIGSVLVRKYCS